MPVTHSTLALLRNLRLTVGTEADAATRALAAAWVRAWDDLGDAWHDTLSDIVARAVRLDRWPPPWDLARIDRLQGTLTRTRETLASLGERTGVIVTDGAGTIITATADAEPRIISSQLPAAERAAATVAIGQRVLPGALEAIVARTRSGIVSAARPLADIAAEAMRRELIRGISLGDNPNRVAGRMLARVHGAFDGGLSRAMLIARTEILDAYRATAAMVDTANGDLVRGWRWVSALDSRTCVSCWAMHGTEHPTEAPGPEDHPQGRCARAPVVRPWSELGITTTEPRPVLPDARRRFDALPLATQVAIMGQQRLDLLRSGRITWGDLVERRERSGWRPYFVPRPLRNLQRIATRVAPAPAVPTPSRPPLPRRQRAQSVAAPPTIGQTAGGRPQIGDLVAATGQDALRRSAAINDAVKATIDATYAGLTVRTRAVYADRNETVAVGEIYTSGDRTVGEFARAFARAPDGTLYAAHASLVLAPEAQGLGFARAFNAHLERWYRESGLRYITIVASLDVGGYAWARAGYVFETNATAQRILKRLGQQTRMAERRLAATGASDPRRPLLQAEVNEARELLERGRLPFDDPRFPTPFEISEIGRPANAVDTMDKSTWWLGKRTLIGSEWLGRKWL